MKNDEIRPEELLKESSSAPEETTIPAENSLPRTEPSAEELEHFDVDALLQDLLDVTAEADGFQLTEFNDDLDGILNAPIPEPEPEPEPISTEEPEQTPSADAEGEQEGSEEEGAEEPHLTEEEAATQAVDKLLEETQPEEETAPLSQPEEAPEQPQPEPEQAEAEQAEPEQPQPEQAESEQPEPQQAELEQPAEDVPLFIPAHELADDLEEPTTTVAQNVRKLKNTKKGVRKRFFLGYFIAEGFRGLFSHSFMSFAAASIMTICLLILGTFSLVALNLNVSLEKIMSENEFLAYVDETLTDEEAAAIQAELESITNVASVEFVSRQEAKVNYVEDQGDPDLYEDLPDDVFRHRYVIWVEDLELLEDTVTQTENTAGIAEVQANQALAEKFVTIRDAFLIIAAVLVACLMLVSLFIIFNTIKLATVSRQEEISIMKMCGATNGFVRWPFIYEGAIIGLVAAGVAFGLQYCIYLALESIQALGLGDLIQIVPWSVVYLYVLVIFFGVALILGILGSVLAIRKFLKV